MAPRVLVQVTICDTGTGEVEQVFIETTDSQYKWDIERVFERLGERVAKLIDPNSEG